jgi:hypothetical protein
MAIGDAAHGHELVLSSAAMSKSDGMIWVISAMLILVGN